MTQTDKEKLEAIKEIIDIYDMRELDYTSLGEDVKKIKKILDSTIWQNSVAQLVVKFSMTKK